MGAREDHILGELNGQVVGENGVDGIQTIDPSTIDTNGNTSDSGIGSEPKRGRGRPSKPNSGTRTGSNSTSKTKVSGTVGIENILLSIHMMMAGATKIEEFKLSEDESKKLAKAITDVNQFYNLGVDPKLMVWVNLVTACTAIYAPKFVIYKMRKSMEAKRKKEEIQTTQNFPIGVS